MNLLVSSRKICLSCLGVDYLSFSLSISSFNSINRVVLADDRGSVIYRHSTGDRSSLYLFRRMLQVRASICHPTGLPVFSVYSVITSIRFFRVVLADAASARIYLPPDWTPSFFYLCSRPRPRTWREETREEARRNFICS